MEHIQRIYPWLPQPPEKKALILYGQEMTDRLKTFLSDLVPFCGPVAHASPDNTDNFKKAVSGWEITPMYVFLHRNQPIDYQQYINLIEAGFWDEFPSYYGLKKWVKYEPTLIFVVKEKPVLEGRSLQSRFEIVDINSIRIKADVEVWCSTCRATSAAGKDTFTPPHFDFLRHCPACQADPTHTSSTYTVHTEIGMFKTSELPF